MNDFSRVYRGKRFELNLKVNQKVIDLFGKWILKEILFNSKHVFKRDLWLKNKGFVLRSDSTEG